MRKTGVRCRPNVWCRREVAGVRLSRYRGYGMPPPSASAIPTVARIEAIATVVANINDRRVRRRFCMRELLVGQGRTRTPTTGYAQRMRKSTIAKHLTGGEGSSFAKALGLEIRARRVALGLSQATVASPMSRAFMSSVERGRYTPSLAGLLIIARQLNTSAATILEAVDLHLEARDSGNQDETNLTR
jgi:transcriptional regulator with XRE-family HTH domain